MIAESNTAREAILIRTQRAFVGLLATVATVVALMVPAGAQAKTLDLPLAPLDAILCPLVGTGSGSLIGGALLALNIRVCE